MTLGQTTSAGQSEFQNPGVRAAARPLLRTWLKAVELKVRTKHLKDLDYRLAAILTNYPSANVGTCWPGQKRLAFQAGRSERTIREALRRLEAQGLLIRRRGGQGHTSSYAFTIDGKLIFGAQSQNRKRSSAQMRQAIAGQERQEATAKPLECDSPEENSSPCPSSPGGGGVIDLTDLSARTNLFDQFWEACNPSERGKKGPASAEWDKLGISDITEIANRLSRSRHIDLDGMWACRWLKQRRWK